MSSHAQHGGFSRSRWTNPAVKPGAKDPDQLLRARAGSFSERLAKALQTSSYLRRVRRENAGLGVEGRIRQRKMVPVLASPMSLSVLRTKSFRGSFRVQRDSIRDVEMYRRKAE